MCGRFTQNYTWDELHAYFNLFGDPRNLRPRRNIAPTTTVDCVRLDKAGRREVVSMRWGLIPGWWKKSVKEVPATFNARAETVAEKPMFRGAFKTRRCIIPMSGFYEWTDAEGGKQPHYFTAADGSPVMGVAGLWDEWTEPGTGEVLTSCTMIVTGASKWMGQFHDRMPVFLGPQDHDRWLSGAMGAEDLRPATEDALRSWPVSRRVNKAGEGDDDPSLTQPVD